MKKVYMAALFGVMVCMFCARSSAQTRPVITSFHANGELIWTNVPGTNAFAVEWASSLTGGEWYHSWSHLESILSTSSQNVAYVPMFYRVVQGFSDSSLAGPWIISIQSETNHNYIIPNGAGICTEWGVFHPYAPPGMYSVDVTGNVAVVLFMRDNPEGLSLTGRFATGDKIVFEPPMEDILLTRVDDPSLCQGSWTGTLHETSGLLYPVTFEVTDTGWIQSFIGLPALVRGRMFANTASNLACFLQTGADPEEDPYNQVQITGMISNGVVHGTFVTDYGTNDNPRVGSALFQRQ